MSKKGDDNKTNDSDDEKELGFFKKQLQKLLDYGYEMDNQGRPLKTPMRKFARVLMVALKWAANNLSNKTKDGELDKNGKKYTFDSLATDDDSRTNVHESGSERDSSKLHHSLSQSRDSIESSRSDSTSSNAELIQLYLKAFSKTTQGNNSNTPPSTPKNIKNQNQSKDKGQINQGGR